MFLVDDILLFPFTSILWVFKEVYHAVEQEQVGEVDAIKAEMTELYMMLETGRITEDEFDDRERILLDRLDAIENARRGGDEDEEDDSEERSG
jgi:hypothetical protein